jgi:hypothetical protein
MHRRLAGSLFAVFDRSKGRRVLRFELVDSIPLGRSGKIKMAISKFGDRYDYFGRS